MNTAALKAFAPAVRRQLLEAVSRKLDYVLTAQTPDYLTTYAPQVAALRTLAQADRTGLIERVAYTWFNRLTALRYLDARGWHPFRSRVLMPSAPEETQPEILKLTRNGALPAELGQHTNPARLNDLLDGRIPSADAQGEVYRHLVLAACHFYHALLPDVFERLDDETELLLPDDLLTEHSVAQPFRTEITDEDCAEVEIIGWLYQFYISERKDEVMGRKSAVPKEDIPAVTQLFTPHWIVRYLVENSLGRLWLLNRPESRLREQMPYYIEGEPETDFLRITRPEEIRVLDPACGSGHMLTYAFDLLFAIYEEEGYPANDIPALILKHNLHGVDLCPRAAQLAELALLFKAREKSRRFFQPEYLVRPNVMELREIRFAENELREYIRALDLGGLFNESLLRLMYQFEESKNFGSLIQPGLDGQTIAFVRGTVEAKDLGSQLFLHATHQKVLRTLEQAEVLTPRYHTVIMNPPYLGGRQMNGNLKQFAERLYPDSKADLFSMFIDRSFSLLVPNGFSAMITMQSWMFLSTFEALRTKLLDTKTLHNMAHLGSRAFDSIGGEVVQATAFVFGSVATQNRAATFLKLISGQSESDKQAAALDAIANQTCGVAFRAEPSDFRAIPGRALAYWISESMRSVYRRGRPLKEIGDTRQGMATSDNNRFLRRWFEISQAAIGFGCSDRETARACGAKWFPYNKGGEYRKWFGNQEYVVNWANDGRELLDYAASLYGSPTRTIKSISEYFKPCISWSKVATSDMAVRYYPPGFIFDVAGCCIFFQSDSKLALYLGFVNSIVANELLKNTSPTLNYEAGHLAALPILDLPRDLESAAASVIHSAITVGNDDWDNVETSWNFRDQPLLRSCLKSATLEASWRNWEAQCAAAVHRMQELETENNRLFIEAYGLQDELLPNVSEEKITLARADARRDMAAFLSYAVGCMMGRYSLNHAGLILANAGESVGEFLARVGVPQESLTFHPNEDGIIAVLDGEWFDNDVVARTREFLRVTFGDATLRENIRFIEDSLGKDLRKYFVTDFYKDHLQTYKKRPIYWMVQSPRKSFSVLIYLHRYTRDTLNIVLNRYLRDFEVKLRNRIEHLARIQADANTSTRDKTAARKESDKLIKAVHDCEEWERQTVLPLAQARIELDLDDGVKANYLKLGEALAPIPGLAAAEE
jgi:hypothetical protein